MIPPESLIDPQRIIEILYAFPSDNKSFQINNYNSPANVAGLKRDTMCAVAKKIDDEYRRLMNKYLIDLDSAISKDRGRHGYVEIPHTLSICSTYQVLLRECIARRHEEPFGFERFAIQIMSLFTTRIVMERQITYFPNEYGAKHRREWMVYVTIREQLRIRLAIREVEECAKKCITNIEDAQAGDPLSPDDKEELEQMEKLYTALKPGSQLQLPGLDAAKQYLIGH